MIGRYGGCFEEGIWWVYDTGERCAVLERLAMVEGRKVRIIHGLNISHKRTHILIAKIYKSSKQSTTHMLLGEGLVGVNHRVIPTSTQRMTIKEIPHASNLSHNGYHTCMLWDLQTSTQVFLKFTTTLLA